MHCPASYIQSAREAILTRIIQPNLAFLPKQLSSKKNILEALANIAGTPEGEYGLFPSGLLKVINKPQLANPKTICEFLTTLLNLRQSDSSLDPTELAALDDAICHVLKACAVSLTPEKLNEYSEQFNLFLNTLIDYKFDLADLISQRNFSALISHGFDVAFKLIECQWEFLPAEIIISILKYYAGKDKVKFLNQTVEGYVAINTYINLVAKNNPELVAKIQNSTEALRHIQQSPHHYNVWNFIDLKTFCGNVKRNPSYFGILSVLQRIEQENPILPAVLISPRDLCEWAKVDIHFAQMILQKHAQYLSTTNILEIILHYGQRPYLSYEDQTISGVVAVEHIVWDFLNDEARLCLTQSKVAMETLKPFRLVYKSLCRQNLGDFALRLAAEPCDDYKDEVRRLLIAIEKSPQPLNLVAIVTPRVVKAWAKVAEEFADSILKSQRSYLAATDFAEIRLHHKMQPAAAVKSEVVPASKNAAKPIIQKFKEMSDKENIRPETTDGLPKIHLPVLGGKRNRKLTNQDQSYLNIKGKNIFHENTLLDPNIIRPSMG